jgi:hypothetical protein
MARINLDDRIFADIRFKALCRIVGNHREAIGTVIEAFQLGQKYWGDGKKLIPLDVWEISGLDSLITSKLAEKSDNGVYIKGSEDHFEWYVQKIEASKLGVKARRKKAAEKQPYGQPIGQPIGQPLDSAPVNPPAPAPVNIINTTSKPKQSPKKRACLTDDPEWVELGRHWLNHATAIKPNGTNIYQDWNPNTFGYHLEKSAKRHELDLDFMYEVFNFIVQDDFWRSNAISPANLSKKSTNGLSKLDNILNKMDARKPAKEPEQLSIPSFEVILRREQELKAQFENKNAQVET